MTPNEKLFNLLMQGDISTKLGALFNLIETEEQYIEILQKYPRAISCIKNPSEKLLVEAIKQIPTLVLEINSPSDNLILAALSKNGELIHKFKNATNEMWITAVRNNPNLIQFMPKPSTELMLEIIEKDPYLIKIMKGPIPVIVQKTAVLRYIEKSKNTKTLHNVIAYCPNIKEFSQEICDHLTIKDIIE